MQYNVKTEDDYQDKATTWWSSLTNFQTKGSKNITLQVTERCNLACTYCYQINKSSKRMSFEVAKKYIDVVLNDESISAEYESLILDFIGGEPFLEIKLISKVVDYYLYKCAILNSKFGNRFMISICTNGTLNSNPLVQKFIKKHHNHLSLSISIDGNKMLHDACRIFVNGKPSYDIAVKSAKEYQAEYGVLPGTKMTLAPENINYLYDAILNLIDLGYTNVYCNYAYEPEWTIEHARVLYKELKRVTDYLVENNLYDKIYLSLFDERSFRPYTSNDEDRNWCGGNGEMLAVDPEGTIYPCLRYMRSSLGDSRKPITCGSVFNVINHTVLDSMNKITRTSQSTVECNKCQIAVGCSWCTAYNYQATGSINKRVINICIMHKARSLANVYYFNTMYKLANDSKVFKRYLSDKETKSILGLFDFYKLDKLVNRE